MSYEVGTSIGFRAIHVMPGMEGPEGQPHAHDYRLDVVVTREELDARGMVADLDVLDRALRDLAAELDGRDLEEIRPDDVEAVTVEVLARWTFARLAARVREAGGERLAVRVWESDVAFGGYRAAIR